MYGKKVVVGLGELLDKHGNPVVVYGRAGAQRLGDKMAQPGWKACIFEAKDYYRISFGAQKHQKL